jgi:CRP-like cAMP-binding protein
MYVDLNIKAGEILFKEGDQSDCLYTLRSGELDILKFNFEANTERVVGHVYPGEIFGEMSFLDNMPRSATVKAKTDCKINMINRSEFEKILNSQDPMIQNLLKTLSSRLRQAINQFRF